MRKILLFLLFVPLFIACNEDDSVTDYEKANEEEIQNYLEDNNLTATKNEEFGYYYIIEEEGDGVNILDSNVAKTNYTSFYTDGETLDQSEDGSYFIIESLITGLRLGLTHFSKGASGKIIIPSKLAFNDGKVIIFEINEVLDVYENINSADDAQIQEYLSSNDLLENSVKTNSGLYYFIEEEGDGENPTNTDNVTVTYKGYFLNDNIFDQSTNEITFNLQNVIQGWSEGITYFKEGGTGKLFIPSKLGYGSSGSNSIPANAVLIFDVNLISIN